MTLPIKIQKHGNGQFSVGKGGKPATVCKTHEEAVDVALRMQRSATGEPPKIVDMTGNKA